MKHLLNYDVKFFELTDGKLEDRLQKVRLLREKYAIPYELKGG